MKIIVLRIASATFATLDCTPAKLGIQCHPFPIAKHDLFWRYQLLGRRLSRQACVGCSGWGMTTGSALSNREIRRMAIALKLGYRIVARSVALFIGVVFFAGALVVLRRG